MSTKHVRGSLLAAALLVTTACTALVETEIQGTGLGEVCTKDSECHAGQCDKGMCVAKCTDDATCPAPTKCFDQVCQTPLKAKAFYVGVIAKSEGWTLTHDEGLKSIANKRHYLDITYQENLFGANLGTAIEAAIDDGVKVVVTNSLSQRDIVSEKAAAHPDVRFLMGGAHASYGRNAGSFWANAEQAWYVAGQAAAKASKAERLGIIASYVTPETVRHINAFTLGARSQNETIPVEVVWLGFWSDGNTDKKYGTPDEPLFREELLAKRLISSGCDVIAHLTDTQRSVSYIDLLARAGKLPRPVYSLTNDNRDAFVETTAAGKKAYATALGGVFFNWAPVYDRLFEALQHKTWEPSASFAMPMTAEKDSPVGFQLNPENGALDEVTIRGFVTNAASKAPADIFRGPYTTTGQRSANGGGAYDAVQEVMKGETPTEDEIAKMCFFVNGVVERTIPADPQSTERAAFVPDDRHKLLDLDPTAYRLPGLEPDQQFDCRKNQ